MEIGVFGKKSADWVTKTSRKPSLSVVRCGPEYAINDITQGLSIGKVQSVTWYPIRSGQCEWKNIQLMSEFVRKKELLQAKNE